MAPVGHVGANLATFHGIPNTLQTLYEMPKLTASVPLTPSQPINAFPGFSMDIPQSSNHPAPTPSTTFLPANLLMSCNMAFLPQQWATLYALQLQQQSQQNQQHSPPAINNNLLLNPMNSITAFMPAFVQQPFFGNLPLTAALPIIQTPTMGNNQLFQQQQHNVSKPDQTPPAANNFLHSSSTTTFFNNTPTASNLSSMNSALLNSHHLNTSLHQHHHYHHQQQNIVPSNTFTLVNNNNQTETQQKNQFHSTHLDQQQISPPTLRADSPELHDPNMPPMLQPELPCINDFADSDDFSAPDLLPDRFFYDDEECGPPRLEPQVPIPSNLEAKDVKNRIAPISPPPTDLSKLFNNNNIEKEPAHPLLASRPILAAMLLSAKKASSPDLNILATTIPSTTLESTQINGNRKRERSFSVDSTDEMLKMPKLISMIEKYEDEVVEEARMEIDEQPTTSTIVEEDQLESTIPPALESTSFVEHKIDESIVDEEKQPIKKQESIEEVHESNKKIEEERVEDERVEEPELTVSVETKHDDSIASSSGVSSANSSLLTEEPIIIRFKRPVEAKPVEQEEKYTGVITAEDWLQPLTPVQNTAKLRPRQQKPPPKKTSSIKDAKSRAITKVSVKTKKSKGKRRSGYIPSKRHIKIQSDWQPVDAGQYFEFRLGHDVQATKRLCFNAIQHNRERDEVIRTRDCVKVCSSEGLENIGKVLRLFLDESTGAICVQVLWYYTQAQIASKDIILHEKELLASKHTDVINADSIEEHAFVLTYAEYCRFVAETRLDELPPSQRPLESVELASRGDPNYQRRIRLPHEDSPIDLVYWCQRTFSIKTRKICVSAPSSRRGSRNGRRR